MGRLSILLFPVALLANACGAAPSTSSENPAAPSTAAANASQATTDAGSTDSSPFVGMASDASAAAGGNAGNAGDGGGDDDAGSSSTTSPGDDAGTSGPQPQVIPVTVAWAQGGTKVSVQVSIGGGPPFAAQVDTGSVGLRILSTAVPAGNWTPSTTAVPNYVYGGSVVTHGVTAQAMVQLGGISVPTMVTVEDVTSRTCTASSPGCDVTSPTFRNGDVAVFGVGMRSGALDSPLSAISQNGQYILALPPAAGMGISGQLILDPSAAELARFTSPNQLPSFGSGTSNPGAPSWDDTQMPFCVNQYCNTGIFDLGGIKGSIAVSDPSDFAALGVADGATTFDPGDMVTEVAGQNASWSFTVGNPAFSGVDLFAFGNGTSIGNNLGPAVFYAMDALYDYRAGTIAFAPKK